MVADDLDVEGKEHEMWPRRSWSVETLFLVGKEFSAEGLVADLLLPYLQSLVPLRLRFSLSRVSRRRQMLRSGRFPA